MPLIVSGQVISGEFFPAPSANTQVQEGKTFKDIRQEISPPQQPVVEEEQPKLFRINNQDPSISKRSQYVMDMLTNKNT